MKQSLSLRGLHVPLPFIFLKGFLNGRFRTAALSGDDHLLTSAYISGKCQLYRELCHDQMVQLEQDLSSVRTEAETALLALHSMGSPFKAEVADAAITHSTPRVLRSRFEAKQIREDARRANRAAESAAQSKARKEQYLAERTQHIERLVEIKHKIHTRENTCREELDATASALRERMCVYGHGVLLRPFTDDYLPTLDPTTPFRDYKARHQDLMSRIDNALEQEELSHV